MLFIFLDIHWNINCDDIGGVLHMHIVPWMQIGIFLCGVESRM
jgi:hypothetical protein